MTRLLTATLLGATTAGVVAWRLGGLEGAGVLLGFLLGAGISGLGVLYQRHVLLTRPEFALGALAVSFLAKLLAMLIGALAFRYVEAAAERADWKSFLIAFAATGAVLLPLGAMDVVRERRVRTTNPKQVGL